MHHFFDAIQNTRGDALIGYYVRLTDSVGNGVSLYADANLTPIIAVSGVADAAKVDSDGNVDFYVASGTYTLNIYATDSTTLVKSIIDVPMLEEINSTGTLSAATRSDFASITGKTAPVFLQESGREGTFVWSTSNLSANVTADTQQGIYVAPASDTTGASGAWVRRFSGAIQVSWFGATGDGVTDDGAALAAVGAFVTYQGGGTIGFTRNATYLFDGAQTFHAIPINTFYNWPPTRQYIMEISGCTKPVIIRMNGATIKNKGGKYGSINSAGTANGNSAPYTGNTAATPYYAMFYLHDNTGGGYVEDGELDGNISATYVGSPWGDTGIQLQMTGALLQNNLPAIQLHRVYSHHHGLDGVEYDGPATAETSADEHMVLRACRLKNNGRNNLSVVGGKGGRVENCQLFQAGKNVTGSNSTAVSSSPTAGIDFEAEGSKIIRDWLIDERCAIYDNTGLAVVVDNGDTKRLDLRGYYCGTTNYSLWLNKPDIIVRNAIVQGTVTQIYVDSNNPQVMPKFERVRFTNDPALSPTGAVYTLNGLLIEGGVAGHDFTSCRFEKTDNTVGGGGNTGGPRYANCEFLCSAGALTMYGRFFGKSRFVNSGTGACQLPGGANATTNVGDSEGVWSLRSGGVLTEFGGTWTSTAQPITVNSTNSASLKVALQDAGVTRSYIGTNNGSGIDFTISNADGSPAFNVYSAGNSRRFELLGGFWSQTANARLGVSTGIQAFYDSVGGAILEGGGSSYDVSLRNNAGAAVARVPTGTTDFSIVGNLKAGLTTVINPSGVLQAAAVPAFAGGDVTSAGGSLTLSIGANKVTRSMLAATSGAAVLGASAAGNVTDLTTLPAAVMPAHTGDVTSSAGTVALTVAANAVTFAKMQALSAGGKLLGSAVGSTAVAEITVGTGLTIGTSTLRFANISATTLLGNSTGGATTPGEITLAGGLAFSGTTLTAAGALTPTSVVSSGAITSSSAAAGIGYSTGAGGTVTQITSRTTGVTVSKVCGSITLVSAAGSATWNTFTVTNSAVAATDTVEICQKSGANLYNVIVTAIAAGTFNVSVSAVSGTATESPVFNFVIVKAVNA